MEERNEIMEVENTEERDEIVEVENTESSGGGFGFGMFIGSIATLAVFAGRKAWKKRKAKKEQEDSKIYDIEDYFEEFDDDIVTESEDRAETVEG